MSSMVAKEPVKPAQTPEDVPDNITIRNGAFWPDISTGALRLAVKLDGQITASRVKHAAIEAITMTNDMLRDWRLTQEAAGVAALADIPEDEIDGVSVLVNRYQRAVYAFTKALLLEGYRDIDTTRDGEKHAEALSTQIDTVWRDGNWAVRDILGLPRDLAELV
ncbi:head completion/stabilization protein [Enterobacteriaceae bacterium ML5]|nr:head completion/stabilization protein [Enterobacteriaceae bacterium ML5]